MNLKNVANIPIARRELLVIGAELLSCLESIEVLKSNVLQAQCYATLLLNSLEKNNARNLFDGYTNLKECCGNFNSHDKLTMDIKGFSNNVTDRMQKVFRALHLDLLMRVDFDDKNLS